MKICKRTTIEVEVSSIEIIVPVNYGEEDMPNDFPGRSGDTWHVQIGIEKGLLFLSNGRSFPAVDLDLNMKVVDGGTYRLLGPAGDTIVERQDYVPDCFPGTHYGDYLQFKIVGGKVENWNVDSDEIAESFGTLESDE